MDRPDSTIIQEDMVSQSAIEKFTKEAAALIGEENVSVNRADLISTCRDYWPVNSIWMLNGEFPALPQVIIWPGNTDDVSKILSLANREKIPVTPYGEGSGALGGVIPLYGGAVLDMKKMNRIRDLDHDNLMVTVECGMNGALYEEELNRAGYTGGHFPQSLRCSSVGGWLACRAAGQFSTRYGKIEDMTVSLEAVLPDGTIFKGRAVPRTSTGPRVDHLFLGSEGILGVITAATLRIWPLPEKRYLNSYTFDSLESGLEAIRLFMRTGTRPAVVRLYDAQETGNHFPELGDKRPALILLFEGAEEIVNAEASLIDKIVFKQGALKSGSKHVEHWLEKRFNISLASMLFQKGAVLDTIEVSTNWHNAYSTYLTMQEALLKVEGTMLASGHYSHVYPEGTALYITTVGFPSGDKIDYYKKLWSGAMEACLKEGAAISHHHGVGLQRGLFMREEHGEGLEIIRRIKSALDPLGIMNPGKLGIGEVRKWQK
ncbi:MAG: FAD-binding oxidoreductase [Bacillota bacterium]|nr:FAD-binding oxidoreductase [Bacillota bacterium]